LALKRHVQIEAAREPVRVKRIEFAGAASKMGTGIKGLS